MIKIEEYTIEKRIKAGFKRFLKMIFVAAPVLIEWFTTIDVPYEKEITAAIVLIMSLEKAFQKDQSK